MLFLYYYYTESQEVIEVLYTVPQFVMAVIKNGNLQQLNTTRNKAQVKEQIYNEEWLVQNNHG
jgi:hypothetical protein